MIVEYIRYMLPAEHTSAFERDYARAAEQLAASPVCLGYELARCSEAPGNYILRIRWRSAEDHLQGFRHSAQFPPFLSAIREYMPHIEEMRHYEVTAVASPRVD